MGYIIRGQEFRWEGPVIPYKIDPHLTNPERVLDAINHWETVTNLRFIQRAAEHDFVVFRHGGRKCESRVGRQGGEQFIDLLPGCDTEAIRHEIGHAVGLIHEHQRPDRDNYVIVDVPADDQEDYAIRQNGEICGEYDLSSIMHYPEGSNIQVIGGGHVTNTGQLSPLDRACIQSHYTHLGIVRRGDSGETSSGTIGEIAAVLGGPDVVVTAVRAQDGRLKLLRYRLDAFGGLTRGGDSGELAGAATSIGIIKIDQHYVTSVRNGSGDLVLIAWSLSGQTFSQVGHSHGEAGSSSLIQMVHIGNRDLVTAVRDQAGNLKLISWRLSADGQFTHLKDSGDQAGNVSEISLVRVAANSRRVATAVRTAAGTLKVIIWDVGADGEIKRLGDSGEQIGGAVAIRCVMSSLGHLVVSCRSVANNLVLISVQLSADGKQLNRSGDTHGLAGAIQENALMARPDGRLVSVVRSAAGNLKLIGWQQRVNPATSNVITTRLGDSGNDQAGSARLITVCEEAALPTSPIITAVKTAAENLKLISWTDTP